VHIGCSRAGPAEAQPPGHGDSERHPGPAAFAGDSLMKFGPHCRCHKDSLRLRARAAYNTIDSEIAIPGRRSPAACDSLGRPGPRSYANQIVTTL
jgi:hypothetical protein